MEIEVELSTTRTLESRSSMADDDSHQAVCSGVPCVSSAAEAGLEAVIAHAAELLPAQGPIAVFVHHNPLHSIESGTFDEGLVESRRLFGCEPYLPEAHYREFLSRGRIRVEDLTAVLLEDLGEDAELLVGFFGTRFRLRQAMLEHPLRSPAARELPWILNETEALRRYWDECARSLRFQSIGDTRHWVMRDLRGARGSGQEDVVALVERLSRRVGKLSLEDWDEAAWEACSLELLWQTCRAGAGYLPVAVPPSRAGQRLRDAVCARTGCDPDQLVHDMLIRFCAAFADQGIAPWALPERQRGFAACFRLLYAQTSGACPPWMRGVDAELSRLCEGPGGALASIRASLDALGIAQTDEQSFLTQTLLALRGWAGMLHQLEVRTDRAVRPAPAGTLVEFLAVRLILDRLALAHVAREQLGYRGSLADLARCPQLQVPRDDQERLETTAFQVFQLAQLLGWRPYVLRSLSPREWRHLLTEVTAFDEMARRRVFHLAYERRYRLMTLDAVSLHVRHRHLEEHRRPRLQVVTCLDEREESFRRALEETSLDIETFGAAGFFGVAMYYRGVDDAHFSPLCPVVIRPQHYVREEIAPELVDRHNRGVKRRRALGTASHRVHLGSRTFWGGAMAALAGSLASIPLVARVLFPHRTARLRQRFDRLVTPPGATWLRLERHTAEPGSEGDACGFTLDEMVDIVERLLCDMGLTSGFARLVVICGHGSSSFNNPHGSAYDCGACGGGRGGPNARAWAQMANDPRIRQRLAARGLPIPDDTYFLGAQHNTCNDNLEYYDSQLLPAVHRGDLAWAEERLELARQFNAQERCRRFESAPLTLSPQAALRHVENRAEDLAQARPECGHATNAICFVGRRFRTRGLYFDRRAFLVSYDPTQDDQNVKILTRILQAVVPVCAGINLEYYFSRVDSVGWGCGTKLPHNIASLVGVMDGAASDLRPGLPWQMVEIHEPVRLLFIIEATPEAMLGILAREPAISRLCDGNWVQLAALSPASSQLYLYRNGRFDPHRATGAELPRAATSSQWYRGWRDHLDFATIGSAAGSNGHGATR